MRSTWYFRSLIEMRGTPGIFRSRRFRSRSHLRVARRKRRGLDAGPAVAGEGGRGQARAGEGGASARGDNVDAVRGDPLDEVVVSVFVALPHRRQPARCRKSSASQGSGSCGAKGEAEQRTVRRSSVRR